jgi:hypothetical protein
VVVYPKFLDRLDDILLSGDIGLDSEQCRWPAYEAILTPSLTWPVDKRSLILPEGDARLSRWPSTPHGPDQVNILLLSSLFFDQNNRGIPPEENTSIPQWQVMMNMIGTPGVQVVAREFDEKEDTYYVRMRMVAIWEAQEAMERGVEERDTLPSVSREGEGGWKPNQIQWILWNIEQYKEVVFAPHAIQGAYRSRGFTQSVARVPAGMLKARC